MRHVRVKNLWQCLKVLKWTRKNQCHWNEETCAYATGSVHLEVHGMKIHAKLMLWMAALKSWNGPGKSIVHGEVGRAEGLKRAVTLKYWNGQGKSGTVHLYCHGGLLEVLKMGQNEWLPVGWGHLHLCYRVGEVLKSARTNGCHRNEETYKATVQCKVGIRIWLDMCSIIVCNSNKIYSIFIILICQGTSMSVEPWNMRECCSRLLVLLFITTIYTCNQRTTRG